MKERSGILPYDAWADQKIRTRCREAADALKVMKPQTREAFFRWRDAFWKPIMQEHERHFPKTHARPRNDRALLHYDADAKDDQ